MRTKLSLVVILVAALGLSGCFGIFGAKVASLEITTEGDVDKVITGQAITLTAVALDADKKEVKADIKWTIDDQELGTIEGKNKTAVFTAADKEGTVTITAKAGDVVDVYELDIIDDKLAKIEVTAPYTKLIAGQTLELTVTGESETGLPMQVTPTFELDNDAAGTVTDGKFKATAVGTATITATVDGITDTFDVEVYEPVVRARKGFPVLAYKTDNGDKLENKGLRNGYDSYFVGWNTPGTWIDWDIEIEEAGDYLFFVRYGLHNSTPFVKRSFEVRIGDADPYIPAVTLELEHDGDSNFGSEKWIVKSFEQLHALQVGNNIVRMENVATGAAQEGMNVVNLGFIKIDEGMMPLTEEEIISIVDAVLYAGV